MAQHYARGEVRRRQIAEAALKLIGESGLDRFTVATLAARLPITGGTIFRHFRNKREIVLAAIDRLAETLFPDDLAPSGWLRLRQFFFVRARLLSGPKSIGRLVFSDDLGRAAGPEGLQRVAELRARSVALVRGALSEVQTSPPDDRRLRSDIPLQELTRLVLGVLLTFRREWSPILGCDDPETQIEKSWSTLHKMLLCDANNAVGAG